MPSGRRASPTRAASRWPMGRGETHAGRWGLAKRPLVHRRLAGSGQEDGVGLSVAMCSMSAVVETDGVRGK